MKKSGLIIAAFALVLGLSQCTKPEMPTINGGNGQTQHITFNASFDNDGSKIAENGIGGIKWEDDDIIIVKQGETPLGTLKCKNASTGTFEGDIEEATGNITFTFGEQSFLNQSGELNDAISLASDPVEYREDGNYGTVEMNMPHAVLKLNFSELATATESDVTIKVGETTVASVKDVTTSTAVRYVALPANGEQTFTFTANGKNIYKKWTLASNKFYTKEGSETGEAISVKPTFTVNKVDNKEIRIEFSRGNLYYDGAFKFEENQWGYSLGEEAGEEEVWGLKYYWNPNHVNNFKWGDSNEAVAATEDTPTGEFFATSGFSVSGDSHNDWRTLTYGEWQNLLGIAGAAYPRTGNISACVTLTDVGVTGLVILPDNAGVDPANITTTTALESNYAIFLPVSGFREGDIVHAWAQNYGCYWTSSVYEDDNTKAYFMNFAPTNPGSTYFYGRHAGCAIRLVRYVE